MLNLGPKSWKDACFDPSAASRAPEEGLGSSSYLLKNNIFPRDLDRKMVKWGDVKHTVSCSGKGGAQAVVRGCGVSLRCQSVSVWWFQMRSTSEWEDRLEQISPVWHASPNPPELGTD